MKGRKADRILGVQITSRKKEKKGMKNFKRQSGYIEGNVRDEPYECNRMVNMNRRACPSFWR